MPKLTSPLDHLRIAAPCSANWDQMFSFEDKRVRFCSQCNLNVYNLSDMSRREAEAFIIKTEGRLCVRFYRKADGSVLTQNCPVGLKAIKRRVAWVAQVVLGMVLSFVSGLGLYIFHLGRKPFHLPDARSIFERHTVLTGVFWVRPISEVPPIAVRHAQGEVMLESRQNGRFPHNKVKRQDRNQRISNNE
jgi:hypothetical protein